MNEFLDSIKPSHDGLLIDLQPLLNDELIQEMAVGNVSYPDEIAANKEALLAYKRFETIPGCMPWNPGEVCNLLRWSESSKRSVSVMKLFGCWILIQAYVQLDSLESGLVDNYDEHAIVALVESAIDLGGTFPAQAARFLYWAYVRLLEIPEHRSDARPFYLFGLLIAAAFAPNLVSNAELLRIRQKLEDDERRVRESLVNTIWSSHGSFSLWLLGLPGNDLNNFQTRCYKITSRLCDGSSSAIDSKRSKLMLEILSRWRVISSIASG